MDELTHARAELARLRSTERMLLKQLLAVHIAVEAQSRKISELVNARPFQINRLPVELLTRIFSLVLTRSDKYEYEFFCSLPIASKNLAGVSRLWRDLILNTPSFWSDIGLTCDSDSNSLMTQLKRSREYPLDITIIFLSNGSQIDALLDILIPSANRWRSLFVGCVKPEVWDNIMHQFNRLEFPRLEDVFMEGYPQFLSRARSPAVRRLDLRRVHVSEHISTLSTTLTTLTLSIAWDSDIYEQLFFKHIPTQSLTVLTFICYQDWVFERNSLHFPLLQRLVLGTVNPHQFMDAIVTPKLQHFDYTHPRGSIIGPFGSKFSHVPYLTLKAEEKGKLFDMDDLSEAHMLCQAFCGVRHASLHTSDIGPLFVASSPSDGLGSQTPVDSWESLERLSLSGRDFDGCYWTVDSLAKWLTKRRKSGRPSLHVQLSGSQIDHFMIETFSRIYKQLRNYCVLDLVGVRLSQQCSSLDTKLSSYFCLNTEGSSLYIRVDDKDSVILDNWREGSLENMDIFWPSNGRLSLSDIFRSDSQEQAFLDDADGDCDLGRSTLQAANVAAVGDLVKLLLILVRA